MAYGLKCNICGTELNSTEKYKRKDSQGNVKTFIGNIGLAIVNKKVEEDDKNALRHLYKLNIFERKDIRILKCVNCHIPNRAKKEGLRIL